MGQIVLRQHQAFPDNWRWMLFVAPGILTCAVAIFIPQVAWLVPGGIVLLASGLLGLVVYMIQQRWGWRCYVLPQENTQHGVHGRTP